MQDELTKDRLIDGRWRFGEKSRPAWYEGLRFLADGTIGAYQNDHEKTWHLQDNVLKIFDRAGALTWRFVVADPVDGRLVLEGAYHLDGGFAGVGVLAEMPPPRPQPVWVPMPSVPDGKVGVLVLGHGAPLVLDRMAGLFDPAHFRFFLHLDAKRALADYTAGMRHLDRISVLDQRVEVYWGGFSMVEAELALLRAALADPEITRVVLISDDSAPLLPPAAIYAALQAQPDRMAACPSDLRDGWYRGFFFADCKFSSLRGDIPHETRQLTPADFAMLQRLEALRHRGKKAIETVYFCRQWWALSRATLEAVLRFVDADAHYVESFRFSLFADEIFFPTAYNICFPGAVSGAVPTYADFATVPRYPNPWIYRNAAEVEAITDVGDCLFLRKIHPDRPELIDDLAAAWPAAPAPPAQTVPAPPAQAAPVEAVRLVVWDLDETFWRGTLTEGGISYVQENHDLVIELSRRGIINSICSKNDLAPVQKILEDRGLWEYFVFPSINWEPKGPRLAALAEAVQLRPPTILFIDDNALNRNEVLHFCPDMQVADETVIPGLLGDARCQGKDDTGLTRLAQYRLLQSRHKEQAAAGDNVAFLRASEIRVTIEHDLAAHIERVVELINRTNQLNFTKSRLPEDPAQAADALRGLLNQYDVQAGLVHVRDRYGDYGFVGVYVLRMVGSHATLLHYCFSCRTLGMGVESWLYERIGRPKLQVVGEVLTDLSAGRPPIDWINREAAAGQDAQERLAGRIMVRGGCAMGSTAHYLALNADEVVGEFNIVHDGLHARRDHSVFLRYALEGLPEGGLAAAARLGYVAEDFTSALAADPAGFDVCVFSFMTDAWYALYRDRATGLRVPFFEFFEHPGGNLLALDLAQQWQFRAAPEMVGVVETLRTEGYEFAGVSAAAFREDMAVILARIAPQVTLIFLLDPEDYQDAQGRRHSLHHFRLFNDVVRELTAGRANVHLLNVLDFVEDAGDRINADHFNRMVYFRFYQRIAAILRAEKMVAQAA